MCSASKCGRFQQCIDCQYDRPNRREIPIGFYGDPKDYDLALEYEKLEKARHMEQKLLSMIREKYEVK